MNTHHSYEELLQLAEIAIAAELQAKAENVRKRHDARLRLELARRSIQAGDIVSALPELDAAERILFGAAGEACS